MRSKIARVALDERTCEAAKKEAARMGISLSELLRQGLARMVDTSEHDVAPRGDPRAWMRFSGIVDSGYPDASLTVHEVVYGRKKP